MTSPRGFAAMTPERRAEISRLGSKSAHDQGRAHRFSSEEAREAGRKGGAIASRDRERMAELGRKGGLTRAERARQKKVDAEPLPPLEEPDP